MTNFVEAGKAAESLTDDGLKQAANFGHPMVPPIVALTEITRRKEMRERYQKARNKMLQLLHHIVRVEPMKIVGQILRLI